MEQDIKLIAVDMDGTFLNSAMEYDRELFTVLYNKMKERGIRFVVASGNQYYQLKSFFGDIQDELAYVAENGIYILDQGEELFCGEIEREKYDAILSILDDYKDVGIGVCGKNSAYILPGDGQMYEIYRHYYHRLAFVDSFREIDDQIIKLALWVPKEDTVRLTEVFTARMGHLIKPVNSGHCSIDLIVPGYDKGFGIKLLCDRWGISPSQCMAFGDSDNDLEMLRFASHSFAMENGRDEVKAVAKYICPRNDEGGVLKTIRAYLQ